MKTFWLKFVISMVVVLGVPFITLAEGSITDTLIKQADYLHRRHEILSQNVANVSTPKYIAQDLEKPEFMDKSHKKVKIRKVRMVITNPHHMQGNKNRTNKYNIVLDKTSPMKPNKNNVDLTKQVTNIVRNSDETSVALKNYRTAMDLISTASGNGGM